MAPMNDQRDSSSPEMGFVGYGADIRGSPSDTSLPFPPPFPAQQPWYLTPGLPIFEERFGSIRRLSQSSVDDPGPYLRPRAPQDRESQNDHEMTYRQNEFEDGSPEPLLLRQGILSDPMENANEFVRKLFKALENPMYHSAMCWGNLGDRFMIKDVEEFTKAILPQLYKHSNFASFVRQLNKYDFHKVKSVEDNEIDQIWCFRHANFHSNRPEDLENVKRKPAIHQRSGNGGASSRSFSSNSKDSSASSALASFTSLKNTSPYLQRPNASSSDHSSYAHKVGEVGLSMRSRSPSRAELYSEILSLKQETEDSKVKMRDLDRTSEDTRTKMGHIQKMLDDQGGVLRLLASQYLPTNEAKRAGK